jgi:putative glutamine amidotransferase
MAHPVIGLTLDSEQPGGYSKLPWYALRNCAPLWSRRRAPVLLPHETDRRAASAVDGIVVTGGAFDVDPALFGATTRHQMRRP